MKHLGKIVGINLSVLLVYSIIIRVYNGGGGIGILIVSAVVIAVHVFASLIISLVYYRINKDLGKAWLFATGVVSLVGLSTCFGNAML